MSRFFNEYAIGITIKGNRYWFRPQEDITTYELAHCNAILLSCIARGVNEKIVDEAWSVLPVEVLRHFALQEKYSDVEKGGWAL